MRLIALLILLSLLGCFTPRKAERQLNRIERNQPDLLAHRAMKLYPIVERIDSFEVVRWRDSILELHTLDTLTDTLITDCDLFTQKERQYRDKIKALRSAISKPVTIIKYINDSTKLYLLRKELAISQRDFHKYRKNYEIMMKLSLVFLACLVLSLIVHLIRYYLKK